MAELKYYVTYGSWNPKLMGTGGDAITKAMEEWTKKIEELGRARAPNSSARDNAIPLYM